MKQSEMLKKNYEFRFVLQKGTYYSGKVIEAFVIRNGMKINRIGIAVRRKIGKAVKRNRVKRLIKETYRLNEECLNTGYSIVFLVRKRAELEMLNFKNIDEDMKNILGMCGKESRGE